MTVADQCADELLEKIPPEHRLTATCLMRPQMALIEAEFGADVCRQFADDMLAAYNLFVETGDMSAVAIAMAPYLTPEAAAMLNGVIGEDTTIV